MDLPSSDEVKIQQEVAQTRTYSNRPSWRYDRKRPLFHSDTFQESKRIPPSEGGRKLDIQHNDDHDHHRSKCLQSEERENHTQNENQMSREL